MRFPIIAVLFLLPWQFSNGQGGPREATSDLDLIVSSETAPAGGWVQIKVFAFEPCQISSGALSMDFDPTIFGDIAEVAVFSATGDAGGYAHVSGQHVDAHFTSPSGGIGQLR